MSEYLEKAKRQLDGMVTDAVKTKRMLDEDEAVVMFAAIAQAEAAERQADALERIANTLDDFMRHYDGIERIASATELQAKSTEIISMSLCELSETADNIQQALEKLAGCVTHDWNNEPAINTWIAESKR